jgi:hypothetical protein
LKWKGVLLATIVILLLAYLPLIAGSPKGWSLYLYWTILAIAEFTVASLAGWGGG